MAIVVAIPVVIPIPAAAPIMVVPFPFVFTEIPVAVTVPTMVMFAPAAVALPISGIEALSIMPGRHPIGARIGRQGPVPCMPLIVVSHRIPVAFHP